MEQSVVSNTAQLMPIPVQPEPLVAGDHSETDISNQPNTMNIFRQPIFTACHGSVWSVTDYTNI